MNSFRSLISLNQEQYGNRKALVNKKWSHQNLLAQIKAICTRKTKT